MYLNQLTIAILFSGLGVGILCLGIFVRLVVTFLVVFGANLKIKEMIFVAFAWFPKATVQVNHF